MRSLTVRTDADDFDIALLCFGMRVAEPARFFRSARRVVFGIEKQHDFFASEIRELHRLAIGIRQTEGGRFVSNLERFCGHSFCFIFHHEEHEEHEGEKDIRIFCPAFLLRVLRGAFFLPTDLH